MPKLPRVSGTVVVRTLKHLGFTTVRQAGSHVLMRRGMQRCVVPLHDEVKVGTLAGLLRQAEISPDEFIAAM